MKRLYVRPEARRAGVARALMAAAVTHARSAGFAEVVLDVMPSRHQVISFYRQLGFVDAYPYEAENSDPMVFLRLPL